LRADLGAVRESNGPRNVEVILRAIKYEIVFSESCQRAEVTPILQIPGQAIPKLKQFKCMRTREGWSCY
jgi:hypothetical protein